MGGDQVFCVCVHVLCLSVGGSGGITGILRVGMESRFVQVVMGNRS